MTPLTVLLIPPAGDATLLADEAAGGRVPWAFQAFHEDYGDTINGGTWPDVYDILFVGGVDIAEWAANLHRDGVPLGRVVLPRDGREVMS